jgi:hypothetical protein
MDYILFYSEYSRPCQYLIQQFPDLIKKSISIDSIGIEEYLKKLKIVSVPTLLILLESPSKTSIVDRIVGYEEIHNWFITTLYRMNQVEFATPEQNHSEQFVDSNYSQNYSQNIQQQNIEQVPESTTNLDTLYLEDLEGTESVKSVEGGQPQEQEPHAAVKTGGISTMKLAEEMKRQREQNK